MKPIILTEQMKSDLIKQFTETMQKTTKITDDRFNCSFNILPTDFSNKRKATILIESEAYLKMMLYVRDTSTEIAWHGVVERQDDKYYIKDVFLYPQTVSGATVNTDQEEYQNWLAELTDDQHNHLRFQGHSHVNFSVSPSSTDINFYQDILKVLPKDDYYIFMILNKSGEHTFLIYDLAQNVLYENKDINMYIVTAEENKSLLDLIKTEKELNCKTYTYKPVKTTTFNNIDNYGWPPSYDYDNNPHSPLKRLKEMEKTETDKLLEDIDNRWKNATLKANKKGGKK